MDNAQLDGFLALKLVAEKRNFAAAANQLGISAPAMSQIIKRLEQKLGVVLLTRTTRTTTLTDVGERFLKEAGPGIDMILNAVANISLNTTKPSGLLRLNVVKLAYTKHIEPIVTSFMKKYPDVSVECFLEDAPSNIFEHGFDAGVRIADILAKDMVAVKIFGPLKFVTAASPKYLDKMGRPKHPRELHAHRCIVGRINADHLYNRWEFEQKGVPLHVQVMPALILNDPILLPDAAVKGLGVLYTTEDLIKDQVKSGKLEIILNAFTSMSSGYYLYYPSRSQVQPKLRAFIDHIKELK